MPNKINKIFILILLVMVAVVTNMSFGSNAEPPKINIKSKIPLSVAGYQSKEGKIPERVFKLIHPEEIIIRDYKNGDKEINLAVVVSENRDNLHAPEICYKLQGFQFKKETAFKLNNSSIISQIDTARNNKPYIFHIYYTDMHQVYANRAEFVKKMIIDKILNKPRKKYALVIAFSDVSNRDDLNAFSQAVNEYILKKSILSN